MQRRLIIAGFALLTVLAAAGWLRHRSAETAVAPDSNTVQAAPAAPVGASHSLTSTRTVAATPQRRTYVKERRKRTSVAIVAGSAGTGAAIGALAGGGKGAAIGALSGGAAGFIYDRLTHRKVVQQ